jgi:small subunit ribosomal protein S17
MEQKIAHRKILRGTVVSDKMTDTAVVAVSRYVKHPKYKKYMKITKKYHAHNPGNRAKEGEIVSIRSCRPLSKTKSFEIMFDAAPFDVTQGK